MQMLAPAWAAPAKNTTSSKKSEEVAKAQEEFNKSYEAIDKLEEIELGSMATACVGGVSFFENIGIGASNLWDKWTNDGQNQQEYKDYIKQIEDCNAKIRQAKKDAKKMKEDYDKGKIDDAKNADASKIAKGGLAAQAEAVDTLRDTLTTAGTTLEKVGKVCSDIATVLTLVNAVLKVVSVAFPPSAAVIAPVLLVTEPAATALGIAGPLIEAAGTSLVESAQAGQFTDKQLYGNMALDVGVEGGKQLATHLVTKGLIKGGGKLAEDIGKEYGDDVANKLVGTCSGAWDPMGMAKTALQSDLTQALGENFADEAGQKALEEFTDATVDYLADEAGIEVPSVSGLVEDGIDAGGDWVKKQVKEKAGLNTGSNSKSGSGSGHGY